MLRVFALLLCVLGVVSLTASTAFAGGEIFVKNQCDKCHSITSLGVESKKKDKSKVVELDGVGAKMDAAALETYLKKETENPASKKKHLVKFKGSDEELKAMAQALEALK